MKRFSFKKKLLPILVLSALNSIAYAADTVDLGSVGSSNDSTDNSTNTATYQAPTQTPIDTTEPKSVINRHYIQNNAAPGANYDDIISIAPSVTNIAPNGPGGMENQGFSIRGFQDGQINLTFDGIPWGDSNDFTHHTTSYFMNQDIGNITVDRGPGDATNVGFATFGGTVAVESKAPLNTTETDMYGTRGSWNTTLLGGEFDSGNLKEYGDGKGFIDYKSFYTDGYMTGNSQRRQNIFGKFERAINDNTSITFVAMYNKIMQHPSLGATLAQMAQYGSNFSLDYGNDQANQALNTDHISTDFEYIGIKSHQGSWTIDNKVYTYGYYHDGLYTYDQVATAATPGGAYSGGTTVAGPNGTFINYPNNIPGAPIFNNYRAVGDILRLTKSFGRDELDTGLWVVTQNNQDAHWNSDLTLNGAYNYNTASGGNGTTGSPFNLIANNNLTTIQPYLQYKWHPIDGLTVTPGAKYDSFSRSIDASVSEANALSHTWTKLLPSLDANYLINKHLSVYAQYAEGFLAPNLNVTYKPGINLGSVNPESTKNYQLGTVWKSNQFTLGADVYRVNFTNLQKYVPNGNYSYYTTVDGATYDGVEFEGTYVIGSGVSLYGNYAKNNYSTSDGSVLQTAPDSTAAAGLIYENKGLYASLISKYTGKYYSGVDANGNNLGFGGYTITNFNMNYKLPTSYGLGKNTKVGMQIYNLFNYNNLIASVYNTPSNGDPAYFTQPDRAIYFNVNFGL